MKGLLSDGTLPAILREVYVGRRSGRLHFSRASERYSVMFVKGDIVHCESSVAQAHLGDIMLGLGMLDQAALNRARAIVEKSGRRMGEVLLEIGAIGQGGLADALAAQVKEHLQRVFTWTDGTYAFQEQDGPPDTITLKLSTGEMILEAVRLARSPEAIRVALGDLARVVVLSSDPLLRFQRITLTAADGFVLSRVDGTSTGRELLQLVPLQAEEAERSLLGLLCTGMVDFVAAPPKAISPSVAERRAAVLAAHALIGQQDHFQVLGVERSASHSELTAAYHRLARRFHPDAHHEPALSDLRGPLDALFERATTAYEALRGPAARQAYIASLDGVARAQEAAAVPSPVRPPNPEEEARRAAEVLEMATARVRDGRQWEAIGLLEGLVTVASGVIRRRARLQLADLYARNPKSEKSAEEQLTAVIAEHPPNVDARMKLAALFQAREMPARATEYVRQVLTLDPNHKGALDLMAALGGAPKGGLKRFFRR